MPADDADDRPAASLLADDDAGALLTGPGALHLLAPGTAGTPGSDGPGPAGFDPHAVGGLAHVLAHAALHAPYGMSVADARQPDLPLVWVNEAFCSMTGYAAEEAVGRNCRILQDTRDGGTDPAAVAHLRARTADGRRAEVRLLNRRRDGTRFWNDLTVVPVHDRDGALTHFVGLQRDVTDDVERQTRMRRQSAADPLTGLPNRRELLDVLAAAARTASVDRPLAVLYVDLDGFKTVNDTHGHAAGDALLTAVAGRLAGLVRDGDTLGRLGGDEFAVVLPALPRDADPVAGQRAAAMLEALGRPFDVHGTTFRVGASIGVCVTRAPSAAGALLVRADTAMYIAKRAGGGRTAFDRGPVRPGPHQASAPQGVSDERGRP